MLNVKCPDCGKAANLKPPVCCREWSNKVRAHSRGRELPGMVYYLLQAIEQMQAKPRKKKADPVEEAAAEVG